MNNNKKLGSKFEKDFADFLANQGYWAHYIEGAAHTGSQPCDIIAIKNNNPMLIDCKTLNNKNGLFPLSRLEENQRLAFKKFRQCNNEDFLLAILWQNNVYLIHLLDINLNDKSIKLKDFPIKWKEFYANENKS